MLCMTANELAEARREREAAQVDLRVATGRLRRGVVAAVAAGMSESEAARQAGVTRVTVRKWLAGGSE